MSHFSGTNIVIPNVFKCTIFQMFPEFNNTICKTINYNDFDTTIVF